jgi:hypothetical protein
MKRPIHSVGVAGQRGFVGRKDSVVVRKACVPGKN